MGIEQSFRNSKEKLHVSDITTKYHESFQTVIVTFQSKVLQGLLDNNLIQEIHDRSFGSSHGTYPIYRVVGHPDMVFYLSPIGAPTVVGLLEEITYAMDIKHIVMYGSCGVLDKAITEGKIIVPTMAYRDEGTSYHYQVASDFIDIVHADKVSQCFDAANIDYVMGYTWTTDGFYRETEAIIQERKAQGCIAVEMEISAVQAFANLRGLDFYTFIYGADNLDASKWDKRILGKLSLDMRMNYFFVALDIAKQIT